MRVLVAGLLLLQATPDRLSHFGRRPLPELVADAVTVAPKQYSVEFENEQMRVLRAKLGADETVPLHKARAGLFVALTDVRLRLIRPDPSQHSVDLAAGQVQWISEDTYSVKNSAGNPVEFLFLEPR